MAATTGTYTINQGDATTASDLYTLFKNTIAPGMGYSSAELYHDVTNSRLVYTKTNQVGTYSTAYYEFYFTNNMLLITGFITHITPQQTPEQARQLTTTPPGA